MILADEDPAMAAGRLSVERRLAAGLAVTPRGLEWPLKIRAQYNEMELRGFGRAQSLLCPHYVDEQGGLCGIWKYRNSVCSTWFCKFVRGAVGREFCEATKHLLLTIELELSRWCAVQLDLQESALGLLLAPRLARGQLPTFTLEDIEDQVEPDKQRQAWANWYGREREFYLACGELVRQLKWSDVSAICGPEVLVRSRLTKKAYLHLVADEIPERLQMGTFTVMEASDGFYNLHHPANGLDPFQLSARIMRLLPHFDGRPTTEIVKQIIDTEGLRFTPELLRRLVDFKILRAVEARAA
jgi:hypothetical protein